MKVNGVEYRTVWAEKSGRLVKLIDQNALPHEFKVVEARDCAETALAIKQMTVRGAPAIGAAAAFGLAQAFAQAPSEKLWEVASAWRKAIEATRPTAVDLFHATRRVWNATEASGAPAETAVREAQALADESIQACKKIGEQGQSLLGDGSRVLTHCNAGWLACVDWGTALSPVYAAHRAGNKVFAYCTETRPRGQGARLTAWELANEGVEHVIIADSAAAFLMAQGKIGLVIVGADRIAANGDTANKIGTYSLAIAAEKHGVPFYVAAPTSTIDLSKASGAQIPIEYRSEEEVHVVRGTDETGRIASIRWSSPLSHAENPAFDVTPAGLVTAFITEAGVVEPSKLTEAVERRA